MAYTAVDDSEAFFKVLLYTGNDTSQAISGVGFSPGLLYTSGRSIGGVGRTLHDAVRGDAQQLNPNSTASESDTAGGVTSLDSDGFTVGSENSVNDNAATYLSYSWKTGTTSGKTTSGETITPSGYSLNATSGVGVFTWSGSGANGTIAHGLGDNVGKGMIIVKRRNSTAGYQVFHSLTGATHVIYLNSNAVADDSNTVWNDVAPTSSVFTLGTNAGTNASGGTYVGMVFAPKQGFSKFGSYTGNGNADGTFVYTGFRPKMLITKITSGTGNWVVKTDGVGDADNPQTEFVYVNNTAAEGDGSHVDFLSNGFKWRDAETNNNSNGSTYLYMAFANAPFVNSEGVPCTAR